MTDKRRNLIETAQILIARHFARLFSRSFHSFHFALTAGETPALPARCEAQPAKIRDLVTAIQKLHPTGTYLERGKLQLSE